VAALNAARIAGKTDEEIRQLVVKLEAARKMAA
jgi:prophage regulatory protein